MISSFSIPTSINLPSMYDQIITLSTSLGTCLSAIATCLTVRQIAKQRKSSYRPELTFSCVFIECKKNPVIPTHWVLKENRKDERDVLKSWSFSIPLRNIGLGAAKNISVLWSFPFENITKQVNDLAQKTLSAAYFNFDKGMLHIESENYGIITSMWVNQKEKMLDFVLPIAVNLDPVMLEIPQAYIQIVSSLIFFATQDNKLNDFPEIPPLLVEFNFTDIGESKHKATFAIRFELSSLVGNSELINAYLEPRKLI